MSARPRILVTGDNGYVGSVLAPHLAGLGHDVVGMDVGYFRECTLFDDAPSIRRLDRDIRDVTVADLEGFEAVVHLAALSNDAICNLNANWTTDINLEASIRLALAARAAGVRRFLFASSGLIYGLSHAPRVSEESPQDPRAEYARSKVKAEREIAWLARDGFSPTFLRNGSIYGVSPRMRFDTVLNDLLGAALAERKIVLHGDGTPWRPVVHVEDAARAFAAVLAAPAEAVHNQTFNVGADGLNIQLSELADIVVQMVPGCELELVRSPAADRRSYRADFSKFAAAFPAVDFRAPAAGAALVREGLAALPLTRELYRDPRFTRVSWLRSLLSSRRVDQELRWAFANGTMG
jgi:nucleoside-diphosphate-sugar epimerase